MCIRGEALTHKFFEVLEISYAKMLLVHLNGPCACACAWLESFGSIGLRQQIVDSLNSSFFRSKISNIVLQNRVQEEDRMVARGL